MKASKEVYRSNWTTWLWPKIQYWKSHL